MSARGRFFAMAFALIAGSVSCQGAPHPDERVAEASTALGECRTVELIASRQYDPEVELSDEWDGFWPPATYRIPPQIEVIAGSAGTPQGGGFQELRFFSLETGYNDCIYFPNAGGTAYVFDSCDQGSAGDPFTAFEVILWGPVGLATAGTTTTRVVLEEPIDDGSACTVDTCDLQTGVSHTPIDVDDNDPLTIEVCFPSTGIETWTAPATDPTATTTVVDAWAFLYEGPDPLQTGVNPIDIDFKRAALIEGFVYLPDGSPASLATVEVLNHPEYGSTISDNNGRYLLVVNGGGPLTVDIDLAGHLRAQRAVNPRWQGTARAGDVRLVAIGGVDGIAELDDPLVQVVAGEQESDSRGVRQPTMLVQPGTAASVELENGTLVPLDGIEEQLTFRISEYTVGDDGPERMPAALPPASAFTYAVEIGIDEVSAVQDGVGIVLDEPIHLYLDNFLGFDVGTVVPVGRYDRESGLWVPEENGIVIAVAQPIGGGFGIDLDGDGVGEPSNELEEVGLDSATLGELDDLYIEGDELWYVRLDHLSPIDLNYPYQADPQACSPAECGEEPDDSGNDDPCSSEKPGSIIECSNQVLGEELPVTGTPYRLVYNSSRVPGRLRPQRRVALPLTGDSAPPTILKAIEATVTVAGRSFSNEVVCPQPAGCAAELIWDFLWDGKDMLGRTVQGSQRAVYEVVYRYDAVYAEPGSSGGAPTFAVWGEDPLTSLAGAPIAFATSWDFIIGAWDARADGLGGFTLDAVHHFDAQTSTLYLGDGHRRIVNANSLMVRQLEERPGVNSIGDLVALPDGGVIALEGPKYVYRRTPGGQRIPLAGEGSSCTPVCPAHDVTSIAVGPDGSVYLLEPFFPRIERIAPNGSLSTFAGTGSSGAGTEEGVPAYTVGLSQPRAVAVANDGSVYIAQSSPDTIRRVDANGIIQTVAGQDAGVGQVLSGPASEVNLGQISDMEFGPDGSLYVLTAFGSAGYVLRIDPDGSVEHIAGGGSGSGATDEGIAATAADIQNPTRLIVRPDGTVEIICDQNQLVRQITTEGIIRTIAGRRYTGYPPPPKQLGGPAADAAFNALHSLARTPDGRLLLGETSPTLLLAAEASLPGLADETTTLIASGDGREIYVFDQAGRHTQTIDALLGIVTLDIERDNGMIERLTDQHGRETVVERDSGGVPTAIVGPFGHVTEFSKVNEDGYVEAIEDPMGYEYGMVYGDGGLMTDWYDRDGNRTTFTWDEDGRLILHENEADGITSLTEKELENGAQVTHETPLGRETVYQRWEGPDGATSRSSTGPNELTATSEQQLSGQTTTTFPDGTIITTEQDGDPRFAMQAPIVAYQATTLPTSNLTREISRTRTATLSNPNDWFSLTSATETTEINGHEWITEFTVSNRTRVVTSPQGRSVTTVFDPQGRVTETTVEGLFPISFVYDGQGRLTTTTQGTSPNDRVTTRTYHPTSGLLWKVTDPLNQMTELGRNDRGDVTSETRPDNEVTSFGYDGEQHTTSVEPPGLRPHGLLYGVFGMLETYDPPIISAGSTPTEYLYDLDKALIKVNPPGPAVIDYGYDDAGRLETVEIPNGWIDQHYDEVTGKLDQMAGPYGVDLAFGYDGRVLESVTWSGDVSGSIVFGRDDDFRIVSETFSGGLSTSFGYDNDSLLTSAGGLTIVPHPDHGLVTQVYNGLTVEDFTYNGFGELESSEASYNGSPKLEIDYVLRDKLGRITQKTETILGAQSDYEYFYDDVGRLDYVKKNNVIVEDYAYDPNGNRTSSTNSAGGPFSATFDEQDRILTYGPFVFTWSLNGELQTKEKPATHELTTYAYDALGNLLLVELPNGDDVEYLVDALGRRVGKKVNGVIQNRWIWRSQLQLAAEVHSSGNAFTRYVYARGENAPDLMISGSRSYRLIKDHLGSVRLVVRTSDGAVMQRIDYDSWGRVTLDTNPGFQPFGFAGGLYDYQTGLVRFGARDYDAETGRWISKDPIRFSDSTNLFQYAVGEPIGNRDPAGESAVGRDCGGGAGVVNAYEACKLNCWNDRRFCGDGSLCGPAYNDCVWECARENCPEVPDPEHPPDYGEPPWCEGFDDGLQPGWPFPQFEPLKPDEMPKAPGPELPWWFPLRRFLPGGSFI